MCQFICLYQYVIKILPQLRLDTKLYNAKFYKSYDSNRFGKNKNYPNATNIIYYFLISMENVENQPKNYKKMKIFYSHKVILSFLTLALIDAWVSLFFPISRGCKIPQKKKKYSKNEKSRPLFSTVKIINTPFLEYCSHFHPISAFLSF